MDADPLCFFFQKEKYCLCCIASCTRQQKKKNVKWSEFRGKLIFEIKQNELLADTLFTK